MQQINGAGIADHEVLGGVPIVGPPRLLRRGELLQRHLIGR
ncbi:MAG: hypothetical protein WDN31_10685 [Hyphomicrobium sp.]